MLKSIQLAKLALTNEELNDALIDQLITLCTEMIVADKMTNLAAFKLRASVGIKNNRQELPKSTRRKNKLHSLTSIRCKIIDKVFSVDKICEAVERQLELNKKSGKKPQIRRHVRRTHGGMKMDQYHCIDCEFSTNNKTEHNKHLVSKRHLELAGDVGSDVEDIAEVKNVKRCH